MSKLYPLLTLEKLPHLMSAETVREITALMLVTMVRSKEFHDLSRLQQAYIMDFLTGVQALLLRAYDDSEA